MLLKYEWWRKELSSRLNSFIKLFRKPTKTLCSVTFLYSAKGVVGSGKPKVETVFAWVSSNSTNKDCVVLFNPPGIGKVQCVISDVIVTPVPSVIHKDE